MINKIITLIMLFVAINILVSFREKESVQTVFEETEMVYDNEHNIYNLDVKNIHVTTKNLSEYFNNTTIKVLGIYPHFNYIYEKKLFNKNNYYAFKKYTINQNVIDFEKSFKAILKNHGLNGEVDKININGIKINKIKIYGSNIEVNKLLKKYSQIKI